MAKVAIYPKINKVYFYLRECYAVNDNDGKFKYVPIKKFDSLDYDEWCKFY